MKKYKIPEKLENIVQPLKECKDVIAKYYERIKVMNETLNFVMNIFKKRKSSSEEIKMTLDEVAIKTVYDKCK